jgi:7-cyano-7-deazaguanine synthase in queuosine biosynthesis
MRLLIPFSSGLDSTYLAWKALKKGNSVVLPYFEIQNNKEKVKIEQIHRNFIIRLLEKEFPTKINDLGSVYSMFANIGWSTSEMALIQPPIWIMGVSLVDSSLYDEVHMAYVMEDHALSYLTEIKALSRAYLPFKHKCKQKSNCIKFPIIKTHKRDIIDELPEAIQMLTWTCENPTILFENNKFMIYKACDSNCITCGHRKALSSSNIWENKYYIYYKPINSLGRAYQKEELKIVNVVELEKFLKFNARGNKAMLELAAMCTQKSKQEGPINADCCKAAEFLEAEYIEPTKDKHGKNKRVISKPKRKRR